MKKIALIATIFSVLALLAFATSVMAAPDRILNPSFEDDTDWTYSEVLDTDFTDGVRSTGVWVKQGTYSYLFSSPGAPSGDIAPGAYCQILQSVGFTSIDRISFDAYLGADSPDYEARMLVGATQVWSQLVPVSAPVTPTEYLHVEVDLSGQTDTKDLIIRIYAVGNAPNSTMTCYFDNIKIWGSHSEETFTTVCNNFTGSANHVYMYGENFDAGDTSVCYYDGAGALKEPDTYSSWGGGDLNWSECLFTDYATDTATPGDWHAVVIKRVTSLPTTYDAAIVDTDYVADDVFNVAADAIPEFPTVIAAIGVAGLCFGIYWWMKRRLVYVKA